MKENQITEPSLPKENSLLQRRALFLSLLVAVLCLVSVLAILLPPGLSERKFADIYQDGVLLQTIDLSAVVESYSFTIVSPKGGSNEITVSKNHIQVTDADCPDRLCVSMGMPRSPLLPVVCLPHGLVIKIRTAASDTPDAVTY